MARYWLHGAHLFVGGKKMSKSRGNILYTKTLLDRGYTAAEIRFFLIDGHYRERLSFTEEAMAAAAGKLRSLRDLTRAIMERAGRAEPQIDERAARIRESFRAAMDDDLDVRRAIAEVSQVIEAAAADRVPESPAAVIAALREIDQVLKVLF